MEAFVKRIILLIEILLAACLFTGSVPYGNAKEEIAVNTPEFNWENYNIITHALGGLDGYTYLNSRESFINHYDKGCRFLRWIYPRPAMEYGYAAITGRNLWDSGKGTKRKYFPQKNF